MGQAQISYTLHVLTECSNIGQFTHMLNEWENPTWEFEGKFCEVGVAITTRGQMELSICLIYGKFVFLN